MDVCRDLELGINAYCGYRSRFFNYFKNVFFSLIASLHQKHVFRLKKGKNDC